MRVGSRITVRKDGSGFDGMNGTVQRVDRGPTGRTAKAAGITYRLWYLVKLDEYGTGEIPEPTDELLGVSDEGGVWFRDQEIIPLLRKN